MLTRNKGEWSELVLGLKLAGQKPEDEFILRLNSFNTLIHKIDPEIFINGFGPFSNEQVLQAADSILEEVKKGAKTFPIKTTICGYSLDHIISTPKNIADLRMPESINVSEIRTRYHRKIDIEYWSKVLDKPHYDKFSVKSEVGGLPTIINASQKTKIRFSLETEIPEALKSAYGRGPKQIIQSLNKLNISSYRTQFLDSDFYDTLNDIDPILPQSIADMLYHSYLQRGASSLDTLMEILKFTREQIEAVEKWILESLKSLMPSKSTPEEDGANKIAIVNADGGYEIFTPADFAKFAIERCFFETPSTSRHGIGELKNVASNSYIDLSVQIRMN